MTEGSPGPSRPAPVRVWDPWTRALKWSLAASVFFAWALAGEAALQTHLLLGYAATAIVAARWAWAAAGPAPARLSSLIADIRRAPAYARTVLRPEPSDWPGHNPLGALWLVGLWALLGAVCVTGLLAGPLRSVVASPLARAAADAHEATGAAVVWFIAPHLAAIFFYAIWKNENLVGAMISGWRPARGRDKLDAASD